MRPLSDTLSRRMWSPPRPCASRCLVDFLWTVFRQGEVQTRRPVSGFELDNPIRREIAGNRVTQG